MSKSILYWGVSLLLFNSTTSPTMPKTLMGITCFVATIVACAGIYILIKTDN